MKKFLAFLLIFAMLLPLAACGEKPVTPEPVPNVTEPVPESVLEPILTPAPIVEPTPALEPIIVEPTPTPQPAVEPTPSLEPIIVEPTPTPQPAVEPTPSLEPIIVEPTPTPQPAVEPTPSLEPIIVEPTPTPQPAVEPTLTLEPIVESTPTPQPVVEPIPAPEPAPEPTPVPVPTNPLTYSTGDRFLPNLMDTFCSVPLGQLDRSYIDAALQATALAFYRKNPYMQYDWGLLTGEPKLTGMLRRTPGQSPEQTAYDSEHYSQCSEFCYDVWYEACGLDFMGDKKAYGNHVYEEKYAASILTGYDVSAKGAFLNLTDREKALDILKTQSLPGDIILAYTSGGDGHVMMFVGDVNGDGKQDMMHCWPINGSHGIDEVSGDQGTEKSGSIVLQTVEELLLTKGSSPNWCVTDDAKGARWYLFRPTLMEECKSLTFKPAAAGRLKYPDIEIQKAADRSIYSSVKQGEEIVITETVRNYSAQDYRSLNIIEYIPDGTELVSAEGAAVNGANLVWVLDIPAGGSATVSYTVKNLLSRGQTLTVPAGWVDTIPSRTFGLEVGGSDLSSSQLAALDAVSQGVIPESMKNAGFSQLDFFNTFYREVLGTEIGLPSTVNDLLPRLFTYVKPVNVALKYLTPKTAAAEDRYLSDMVIYNQLGGRFVSFGTDYTRRAMAIRESYFTPGDLFFGYSGKNNDIVMVNPAGAVYYIYLGNGRVLAYTQEKGVYLTTYAETIDRMLILNLLVGLRPTQGWDDLSAVVTVPQLTAAEVRSEAELLAAVQSGAPMVRVAADLTLSASADLGIAKLSIAQGCTLSLGNYDLTAAGFVDEGGAFTAGSGRLVLKAATEADTAAWLRRFAGQPVRVECAYADPLICNRYDCLTSVVEFKPAVAADGAKNLVSLLGVIPDNWTMKMMTGYVSSASQTILSKGFTIDINGKSFGLRTYEGQDFTVIDSQHKGTFYFRGDTENSPRTQKTNISAPGVKVALGYSSNSLALSVEGTLIYGTLVQNNGSTVATVGGGKLIQQS